MTFGSLFAGIGGMDLGLERAGMQCVWQVEINDYARRVLTKHWPNVRRHDDVRTFPPTPAEEWGCDLIAGGFPCQDISNAGRRAGIHGERSGLWIELARCVRLLRPRFVLVENSAALLGRGMGVVVSDLAECGYDVEWDCLPAAAFGAVHIRNRLFLLAYHHSEFPERRRHRAMGGLQRAQGPSEADSPPGGTDNVHNAVRRRYGAPQEAVFAGRGGIEPSDWWAGEPGVGRVVYGVPDRVDRIRCLGNAVVPAIAEYIGRRILTHAEEHHG